jgi:hypothetical protein
MVQIILTGVLYAWLFAVLFLVWRIWRSSVAHIHHMETVLFDAAMKSAEAAKTAAEAARGLAEKKP